MESFVRYFWCVRREHRRFTVALGLLSWLMETYIYGCSCTPFLVHKTQQIFTKPISIGGAAKNKERICVQYQFDRNEHENFV